jgi:hypothetical protein
MQLVRVSQRYAQSRPLLHDTGMNPWMTLLHLDEKLALNGHCAEKKRLFLIADVGRQHGFEQRIGTRQKIRSVALLGKVPPPTQRTVGLSDRYDIASGSMRSLDQADGSAAEAMLDEKVLDQHVPVERGHDVTRRHRLEDLAERELHRAVPRTGKIIVVEWAIGRRCCTMNRYARSALVEDEPQTV